jgi:hypothetical protein
MVQRVQRVQCGDDCAAIVVFPHVEIVVVRLGCVESFVLAVLHVGIMHEVECVVAGLPHHSGSLEAVGCPHQLE